MIKPSVAWTLLIVLVGVASALRFFSITQAPPGFYIDEAAISAQVICLKQSGAALSGQKWPLFTEVLGGGYMTPSYLFPAIAWTSIFGDSIESFRSLAAFFSVLFIFGSFVFGLRFWRSREAAWLCALSAALSPWVFQFARIAWDPALAPAYLIWAFALLWSESRYKSAEAIGSGVLFSVAAYCYPPLRLEIAIVLPVAIIGLILRESESEHRDSTLWNRIALVLISTTFVSLPLIVKTLSGEIQGRFQAVSVFNHDYLVARFHDSSFLHGVQALIENLVSLLSPTFLALHGDANLRHSTGLLGLWGWLDLLGFYFACVALLLIALRRADFEFRKFEVTFIIVGYLAAILPAAMTWESNPHALRSFGAVVFLVLGVGGSLSILWRRSTQGRAAILGMAFASFLVFVNVYFVQYPAHARAWFDTNVVEIADQLKSENRLKDLQSELARRGISYAPMAVSYYLLANGDIRCPLTPDQNSLEKR